MEQQELPQETEPEYTYTSYLNRMKSSNKSRTSDVYDGDDAGLEDAPSKIRRSRGAKRQALEDDPELPYSTKEARRTKRKKMVDDHDEEDVNDEEIPTEAHTKASEDANDIHEVTDTGSTLALVDGEADDSGTPLRYPDLPNLDLIEHVYLDSTASSSWSRETLQRYADAAENYFQNRDVVADSRVTSTRGSALSLRDAAREAPEGETGNFAIFPLLVAPSSYVQYIKQDLDESFLANNPDADLVIGDSLTVTAQLSAEDIRHIIDGDRLPAHSSDFHIAQLLSRFTLKDPRAARWRGVEIPPKAEQMSDDMEVSIAQNVRPALPAPIEEHDQQYTFSALIQHMLKQKEIVTHEDIRAVARVTLAVYYGGA
ncbi:Hypothetical protein D9617_6g095460 [Elsinoe fawcettii]|nr:Hypothetical protein D9617_6g095460 [Elsinoe fawcettii]